MTKDYITKIQDVDGLTANEKNMLEKVCETFNFQASKYYLSLIDWTNPYDPLRRMVIPDIQELIEWGRLDASDEFNYTILPGLQHKYNSTALMLISNACASVCRYCFRKRIFMRESMDLLQDLDHAMEYIKRHGEITNVLLSGGDPLMLPTSAISEVVERIRRIDHVQVARIGTKMLSYNPLRILNDSELVELFNNYSSASKAMYIMTHFTHPNEITDVALEAANKLRRSGAILANQTPLIKGVNDHPQVLAELFRRLSSVGIPPYYVFQCRPSTGNLPYSIPIEEGYAIFERARSLVSGLGKRARFVMSHSTGKIEVVGKTDVFVYFKYHRAAEDMDTGRFMVLRSNPSARWFDDYQEMVHNEVFVETASA